MRVNSLAPLSYYEDRIAGCLVGGAIGDAMGLSFEGMPGPLQYVSPEYWRVSDDTQLTLATCEAIVRRRTVSAEVIAEEFAEWFRSGRINSVGASTLKALVELAAGGHWALVGRK
jgi:ADP-ribosyl-[dinitrogen reductase] hydrolase